MKDASLLNHSSQNCPHIQCHPRTVEVLLEMKDASLLNHTSQIRPHLQCHPRTVEVLLEMKDASLLNHSSQNCPHIQCHPRTVEVLLEMKDASLLNHSSQNHPHIQCHPRTVEVLLEMKDASLLNHSSQNCPHIQCHPRTVEVLLEMKDVSLQANATNHYHLAMHVFGALTTASTLKELDDMVQSATVVFSSPCCGASVEKHFKNLQSWLQKKGTPLDETTKSRGDAEDLKDITGSNRFAKRCNAIISNAPLDKHGEVNVYQCKGLIDHLKKYVLPFAGLWTGIMLGDLGRHGTGPQYKQCSRRYNALRKLTRQNITQDNKTQGVMEKSQWDLKHIRFTSGRLTRLDDFVAQYRISHTALLKEYEDSERVFRRKTYRVEKEIWKEKQQKKRGRYVSAIPKPFHFKTSKKKSSVSEGPIGKQISPPQLRSSLEGDHENIVDNKAKTTATPQDQVRILSFIKCSYS
ncbi:uncharacterized protein LOC132112707 isoform X12 [Carassius carassius]|uniref:uncharacterized protein LOC132112707 isoform X12 n=1 Tax=Carassius carassius TaxID=217509 RepID=UPI00286854E7|nr:uncharacterized protein LOC132112707 isoform X12 [Carassius carassius]